MTETSAVNADMKAYWNGDVGARWVRLQDVTDTVLEPFGRRALAAAALAPGEQVLDVGCGCGATTFDIARRVAPSGRVVGLDISEPMLAQARARAAGAGVPGITFESGDAQVLDLAAEQFDAICSRFGVMFFDDPTLAFANLRRSLKRRGRLAFACWQAADRNSWMSVPLEVVAAHVALPVPSDPDQPGPLAFRDPDRVRGILEAAGFGDVAVVGFTAPIAVGAGPEETTDFLMQMGPASRAIAEADPDDEVQEQIAADLRAALAARDAQDLGPLEGAAWIVTARNP